MRKFVGVTLFFGIAVAVIAGTCVAFAMLMAPAEIKQIGAAKNVVSKPPIPDVPAAPIEQKTQENVGSVRAASAVTPKISEEESKSAKPHRSKKAVHVVRRRVPERRYTFDRPPWQMYNSYGHANYWRE